MFNTHEEIDMGEKIRFEKPIIVFQEAIDKKPKFFNSWLKADEYGEKYWKKKASDIKFLV